MPPLDVRFAARAKTAIEIVMAGEITRATWTRGKREWNMKRLESLYEFAYLRTFAAWEVLQEEVFLRSLCGYASSAGQETLIGRAHYPSIRNAELAMLGSRPYALWHNPNKVVQRCRQHIQSGPGFPAQQESVIASHLTRLSDLAAIRHRIAHDQSDAITKFDAATISMNGKTYRGARPGKFLRDMDTSTTPHRRWLDTSISELTGLAAQLV